MFVSNLVQFITKIVHILNDSLVTSLTQMPLSEKSGNYCAQVTHLLTIFCLLV